MQPLVWPGVAIHLARWMTGDEEKRGLSGRASSRAGSEQQG